MKICLIRCPSPFLLEERAFPPLGLLAIATSLDRCGYTVTVHDGTLDDLPLDADAYGLGPTAPEYPYALTVQRYLREHCPSARIVLGGTHATLNTLDCLQDGWDCVVARDGEIVSQAAFLGPDHLLIGDELPLDQYPIPDRRFIDIHRYGDILEGRKATALITARGCPFSCAFCCKNHERIRLASAYRALAEVRYLHQDLGFTALAFPEDIFIVRPDRAEAICRGLRDMGILWRCQVRADLCVKYGLDFLRTLHDSGCVIVGMGIESGSPQILETINKGETAETILAGIRLLHDAGIKVKGYFIVGLPGETQDTLNDTRRFMERANLDDADFKIFQPYPGSPIWNHRDRYDVSWNGTSLEHAYYKGHRGVYHGSLRTSALTTEQLVEAWKDLAGKYESRNRVAQP